MVSLPVKKGVIATLTQREWGIEKSCKTSNGNEICTQAPFENCAKNKETF